MQKIYLEAEYRIEDKVYNRGYICIYGNCVVGFFSLDAASIQIRNGSIYFYLKEYNLNNSKYYNTKEFIGGHNIETLECPSTYSLKSSSNEKLTLVLIKKVSNINSISNIVKTFDEFLNPKTD